MSIRLKYELMSDTSWQQMAEWQTPDTPFMSFAFWQALAATGAIGEQAGWLPIYVLIHQVDEGYQPPPNAADIKNSKAHSDGDNKALAAGEKVSVTHPIAVLPVFIKGHHRGEFVFDHAWAEAYARYGVDYYPRLVSSVPYTPITGQRFWLADGERLRADIIKTALAGVDDIAQQVGHQAGMDCLSRLSWPIL